MKATYAGTVYAGTGNCFYHTDALRGQTSL
jgi:hypothetical protein